MGTSAASPAGRTVRRRQGVKLLPNAARRVEAGPVCVFEEVVAGGADVAPERLRGACERRHRQLGDDRAIDGVRRHFLQTLPGRQLLRGAD